jgi:hypothetical protein
MKFIPLISWFIALGSVALGAADSLKPNIIVILADDFGWGSSTPYGAKGLNTPRSSKTPIRPSVSMDSKMAST